MDKKELNLEEMGKVVGGVLRTVNTNCDLNAAVRKGPSKKDSQIASLPNGTVVDTISDQLVYDPVAGRHFVEVRFTDKNGQEHCSSYIYPLHRILAMIEDGRIKELKEAS